MFERRVTRKQLGDVLGIAAPNAGKKVRGEIGWSLVDLYRVANFFQVPIHSLLPRQVDTEDERGAGFQPEMDIALGTSGAPPAGLEPATCGLEGRRSIH